MPPLPLSTLLSQVVVAHTIELDNEFERRFQEAGGGARVTSWTMWANLLRFVGDGVTIGELVGAVGLPRTTVLSRVGGVERWRHVLVGGTTAKRDGYGSARGLKDDVIVELTPAGRAAAGIWPGLPVEIETRWRDRFGAPEVDRLVAVLRAVDEGIDVPLPEFLPVVSSTNGLALEPGSGNAAAGELPLVALLARALMAYTLEFEQGSPLSLPVSANVLRVLDGDGVPVRELPLLTGISKEAVAVSLTSLVKTEYVAVAGAPVSRRTIRLTPAGEALRADHSCLHVRITRKWGTRFGARVGEQLRPALEGILDHPELPAGLTPHPESWRARPPYLRLTRAQIADPRGTLPHHPMVLHRGGWPDGS